MKLETWLTIASLSCSSCADRWAGDGPQRCQKGAGAALGDAVALSASLAGPGALLATSASALTVAKWLGAASLGSSMLMGAGLATSAINRP